MDSCSRRCFLGTLGAAGLVASSSADSRDGGTLRVAHLGDPQFGFETSAFAHRKDRKRFQKNYAEDRARFESAIGQVNAARPDVVFISGDLCQNAEDIGKEWPGYLTRFQAPVLVAAGNHDMGNNVTNENLARFQRLVGCPWRRCDVEGWRLIVVNSQLWFKTIDAEVAREEQRNWLERELATAKREVAPGKLIVCSHIPPMIHSRNEPDQGNYGCPVPMRERYMDSLLEAGCRFYLAGHTHDFGIHGYRGLTIFNTEVTCDGFDRRPRGWRLQVLHADGSWESNFNAV